MTWILKKLSLKEKYAYLFNLLINLQKESDQSEFPKINENVKKYRNNKDKNNNYFDDLSSYRRR